MDIRSHCDMCAMHAMFIVLNFFVCFSIVMKCFWVRVLSWSQQNLPIGHENLHDLIHLTTLSVEKSPSVIAWWTLQYTPLTHTALFCSLCYHYDDVIMTTIASQITSLTIVYTAVYSGTDQRKNQSSASLAFVWGIHRDRWIPRTKGQLRGKCFHLMTSSCNSCRASYLLEAKTIFLFGFGM